MKYRGKNNIRLFLAVELPDMVKVELKGFELKSPNIRWLNSQQYHVTVNFIGEAGTEEVNEVIKIAAEAVLGYAPFEIKLSEITVVHDKMIWVNVDDDTGKLTNLNRTISKSLEAAGIGQKQERQTFRPHVLLAKYKAGQLRSGADPVIENLKSNFKVTPHRVTEIVLFESRLHPSGAEHLPLKTVKLPKQIYNG